LAICSAPFSFSPKASFSSLTFAKSTAESTPFIAWKMIILNNEYSRNYHRFGGLFRFGPPKLPSSIRVPSIHFHFHSASPHPHAARDVGLSDLVDSFLKLLLF
jgi:hypothetical protein